MKIGILFEGKLYDTYEDALIAFQNSLKNAQNATDGQKDKADETITELEGSKETTENEKDNADLISDVTTGAVDGDDLKTDTPGSTLYTNKPEKIGDTTSSGSLDDLIGDADSFVSDANTTGVGVVDASSLQDFSKVFYNILLEIGIAVAVIVGIILGINFMTASVEEKADIKQLVVPYIVGCLVVFGGFGIWSIIVGMLENV